MECRTYLEAMLEAEPAALRGEGDAPLALHVRECARCRQAAAHLMAGNAQLARWLGTAGARARTGGVAVPVRARPRSRARAVFRYALPAAAVLMLAVALGERGSRNATPGTVAGTQPMPPPDDGATPGVVVAPGQNAVVFRTSNPKITVVWYYGQERGP